MSTSVPEHVRLMPEIKATSIMASSDHHWKKVDHHSLNLMVKQRSPYLNIHWIYCLDLGGHPAFLDIFCALFYFPINILTFKLDEKLDEKSIFHYNIQGNLISEQQLTQLQLLKTSIGSLASIDPPDVPYISHNKPHFLLLGTRLDKVSKESLKDKNDILQSNLAQFREVILEYRETRQEIVFPVNTLSRDDAEVRMAQLIRRKISQFFIEFDIPIQSFLLLLELQKTSQIKKIVMKSECFRIGEALKMDPVNVENALKRAHTLGLFLYFPSILPDIVFLDPQSLFNKLSELVSISIPGIVEYLEDKSDVYFPPGTPKQLKNEGIFHQELLTASLSEGFSSEFTPDDFLKLMEDLSIVVSLPQQGMYFLPSVLPICPHLESLTRDFMENVDPLLLTWNMEPIPQGLLPVLAIKLLFRQSSPMFKLLQSRKVDIYQYRNAMRLVCTDLGGAVLLISSLYWLEIYYSGLSEQCLDIQRAIYEGIKDTVKKFRCKPFLSLPQQHFYCTIHKTFNHLCRLDESKECLCCTETGFTAPLDKRQMSWISRGQLNFQQII